AEIIMIELVVPDPVEFHRLLWRQHEIKRRPRRPAVSKWRLQTARRNFTIAHERDADAAAGRIWREIEELAHVFERHVVDHVRISFRHCISCAYAKYRCSQHCSTFDEAAVTGCTGSITDH